MRTIQHAARYAAAASRMAAVVLISHTAIAAVAVAQTVEMKVGFVTINDSQHESAKLFAREMQKRTNGAVNVRIFPAAQLGSVARQIEGLQLGTQEALFSPPGFLVGINPAFQVPDAPGLFESIWHQHEAVNHAPFRDKFLSLAEHAGIKGVYIWSAGNTSIATRTPVRKLSDLNGLKLRVLASKAEVALIGALGATGVPMEFTETLPAIQRRALDGVRTGMIVLAPSKFYTVAKYVYDEPTGYIPAALWVGRAWLNKLPANYQKAIFEAGQALTDTTGLIAIELNNRATKHWIENGGEIATPTTEDRAEMQRRALAVSEDVFGTDPKFKEIYALMRQAASATKGAKPPR